MSFQILQQRKDIFMDFLLVDLDDFINDLHQRLNERSMDLIVEILNLLRDAK